MTMDALHLDVPDALLANTLSQTELQTRLAECRQQSVAQGLAQVLEILSQLNCSALTLLERQRALQSISDEYRQYAATSRSTHLAQLQELSRQLAIGFKRLLLQVLQGHRAARPHLAWCLYMAQQFISQTLIAQYQQYQAPSPSLWQDSHLLYWLGEQHSCLDEPVASAFQPTPADTLRGLYLQTLLLALSNPSHLQEGECLQLFSALAPLASSAQLQAWDRGDEGAGALVDLQLPQPYLAYAQLPHGDGTNMRRLEIGALLIKLNDPAPLQREAERQLLQRVHQNWLGRERRLAPRTPQNSACRLAIGLSVAHAQLLEQRPLCKNAQLLDSSTGGARLLCSHDNADDLHVGQLLLLLSSSDSLALVCWRHINEQGLHIGLRYLKGELKPAWVRRTPSGPAQVAILQSAKTPLAGWHHGLWLPAGQFGTAENLWLQLAHINQQARLQLPASDLQSTTVSRHPLDLA